MFPLPGSTESTAATPALATAAGSVIVQRCEAVLRSSSHGPLRRLTCDFHEGVLSLRGVVPTFYLKQLAQALLGKLAGVEEINNQVVVQPPRQD